MLTIKQALKFLNTFGLSAQDEIMLTGREGNKIRCPVIIGDTIKVMNHPSIRQSLSIGGLPNQYMLSDISLFRGSGMVRMQQQNIAVKVNNPPPLPCRSIRACMEGAMLVTMLCLAVYHFATGWARMLVRIIPLPPRWFIANYFILHLEPPDTIIPHIAIEDKFDCPPQEKFVNIQPCFGDV